MGVDLLFGDSQWPDLALIAFVAIASTVFVDCHLLRRHWFLTFIALTAIAHLSLVLAFPGADLDGSEFKLLIIADVAGMLVLALGLEKLLALRKLTGA